MQTTKFEKLTFLVITDILSSLPMKQLMRICLLGHEKLRNTCSLKWIQNRMTPVTFRDLVRAQQTGDEVADTFTPGLVIRRLKGRVGMNRVDFENAAYLDAWFEVCKGTNRKLHFHSEGIGKVGVAL